MARTIPIELFQGTPPSTAPAVTTLGAQDRRIRSGDSWPRPVVIVFMSKRRNRTPRSYKANELRATSHELRATSYELGTKPKNSPTATARPGPPVLPGRPGNHTYKASSAFSG